MTIPTLTTLPVAPARTDPPATFVTRADAFLAAIVTFQGEMNTSIGAMNTDIPLAIAASATAVAAAASAVAAAGATEWVSGTTYSEGDAVWSPITYQTYRRKTDGAGATDPSADTTNWEKISGVLPSQTGNADKFLTTDGTTASWGNLPASAGSADFVATGAISSGDTVALRSDGTVEVISGSASTTLYTGVAETESFPTMYETQGVYDSVNNKIYIKYSTAIAVYVKVGTPNGSTITWGADQTVTTSKYNNQFGDSGITYDPVEDRVIVFYQDGSNLPTFVAGIVTGTTVGFGTSVSLSGVNFQEARGWGFVYDTEHNTTHFAFENSSDGNASIVPVSVSGTTITLGTRFRPNTGQGVEGATVAYSESLNKLIIAAYSNGIAAYFYLLDFDGTNYTLESSATIASAGGNSGIQQCAYDDNTKTVVLVGGTSSNANVCCAQISGGAIVAGNALTGIFSSAYTSSISIIFDTKSNVFWVAANQSGGNYAPYLAKVTVTSNAASAETGLFYQADFSAGGLQTGLIHDSDTGINYATWGNTSYNNWTQVAFREGSWITNADSYIGIATQTVADAATLTVAIGAGSFNGLSGLTIGEEYWVDYDGSLVTFRTPFAKIGRALSATKILCNGTMDSAQQDLLNPFVQYKDNVTAGSLVYLDGNGLAGAASYQAGTSDDTGGVLDSTNFYGNGYWVSTQYSTNSNNFITIWIGTNQYVYARMGTYNADNELVYTSNPSVLLSNTPYTPTKKSITIVYDTQKSFFYAFWLQTNGYVQYFSMQDRNDVVNSMSSGYIYTGGALSNSELAVTWDDSRSHGIAMWYYTSNSVLIQGFGSNGSTGLTTSGFGSVYDASFSSFSSSYSLDGVYDAVSQKHIFAFNGTSYTLRLVAFDMTSVTTPLTRLPNTSYHIVAYSMNTSNNYVRIAAAQDRNRVLISYGNSANEARVVSVIHDGNGNFDNGTGLSTSITALGIANWALYGKIYWSQKIQQYLFNYGGLIFVGELDTTTSNGQIENTQSYFILNSFTGSMPTYGSFIESLGTVTFTQNYSSNYRTQVYNWEKLQGNFIGLADYAVTTPSKSSVTTVGGVNKSQTGLTAGAKYKASGAELAVDSNSGTMTALSDTEILIRSIS